MSFVAQVCLTDVPSLGHFAGLLASFHYCNECSYEGRTSFGWNDHQTNNGYDVAFLDFTRDRPDNHGIVAEPAVEAHLVEFRDVVEVAMPDDLEVYCPPEDYPQGQDDFDENVYPGLVHVARAKVGGWPTWVQSPEWPPTSQGAKMELVCQLDWQLCENAPWCTGYAYVFAEVSPERVFRGDLAVQTT